MRFLLLLAAAPYFAFAAVDPDFTKSIQLNVEKYQLKNGLTVLLQEDHSVPLVSYHTWYRVGSKDEEPGRTGLAHFFEHMMFKGTPKFSKEYFASELTARGADYNAFTTADYTGYFITIPKDYLKLAISIEADRMRNLALDPKDVQSEREVVKEERRMRYDNQPEGVIRESMDQMIFKKLPYRWTVIGSMDDLNQASMDDLHTFYKRYYSPGDAVVVVAGDFDPAQVKWWISDAYDAIPAEKIDRKQFPSEWDQNKAQEKTVKKNVESAIVAFGYLTPPADSPATYSLDLISVLLGQGDSSRLHKKLVYESQIATSANAGCQEELLASRCMVYVYLKPGASPKTAEKMVLAEVQKLIDHKITAKELEKAKNIYLMDFVNQLKKVNGRAEALAYNEVQYGDYNRLFTDIPNVLAVTPEQIQEAAKKYFKPEHRNVVTVLPQGKKEI